MKRALREPDPLEETLENPDLPPLTRDAAGTTSGRRALRVSLVLGALAVVIVVLVGFGVGLG